MKNLHLYGTLGCHLCDDARDIMLSFQEKYPFSIEEIDITDDSALFSQHSQTIPVLFDPESGHQLLWPFSHEEVEKLLDSLYK